MATPPLSGRTGRAMAGAATGLIQYALQIGLQVAIAPLLLRLAGQETLGAYAIVGQLAGYLALSDFGFSVTLSRYVAQADSRPDRVAAVGELITAARLVQTVAGGIYCVAALTLAANLDRIIRLSKHIASDASLAVVILGCWALIRGPWAHSNIALIATQRIAASNFIAMVANGMRAVLSVLALLEGFGLVGLIAANVVAEAAQTWLATWQVHRRTGIAAGPMRLPDFAIVRELLQFGAKVMVLTIASRLVLQTDNLVVGYLFGATATSIYYSTQMPGLVLLYLIIHIMNSAGPGINGVFASGSLEVRRRTLVRLTKYALLLAIPAVVGVGLVNRGIVSVWVGEGQYAGPWMSLCLVLFVLSVSLGGVYNLFIFASGRIGGLAIVATCEGIANLTLSFVLGSWLGLWGVMLASLLANIPTTVYMVSRVLVECDISLSAYLMATVRPVVIPAILTAAVAAMCVVTVARWTFGNFAAVVLLVGSCYFVSSFVWALGKDDRALLFRRSWAA